jgi:hypothetical protein
MRINGETDNKKPLKYYQQTPSSMGKVEKPKNE